MEGALSALFVAYIAVSLVAVFASQQLAYSKNRATTPWMWAAAIFPPSVVALAALPSRNGKLNRAGL